MEESELDADAPMVALLRFLEPLEMGAELLLGREGRAVDALQLRAASRRPGSRCRTTSSSLTAPICARGLDVRPTAEIHESSVSEDRDLVTFGNVGESRELQLLAEFERKSGVGLVATDDLALEGGVLGEDRVHLLLDPLDVFGRERLVDEEVVLELLAVVCASGIHLRLGEESLDGIGHHVLGGVTDHLAARGIAGGHDLERHVAVEGRSEVDEWPSMRPARAACARPGPICFATSRMLVPVELETLAVGEWTGDATHDRGRAANDSPKTNRRRRPAPVGIASG